MLTDIELMDIHIRALFTHNTESRLLSVNEPGGARASAPRLFLGRTRAGIIWRFRADLPENLCEKLNAMCADEPTPDVEFNESPFHLETYVRLLETHAPVREISCGPAYQFTEYEIPSKSLRIVTENNAELLSGGFEEFIDELAAWQPFVALIEKNQVVSVCRSVRIIPEAHEAGVETLSNFRGKGCAKDVVTEWARLVRMAGAIPLYSTSWENKASQAVARKVNLKCYGTDFHIT
jgi:hypothetical protein